MNYLCIDIGGFAIKYGIAEKNGTLLLRGEMPNVIRKKGLKRFIYNLASITKAFRQKYNLQGIAVSTSGVVDSDSGIVLEYSSFFPARIALKELLEKTCELPCTVENDANAVALGEYWLGSGRGVKSLYCITVGSGIGGGAIVNGRLCRGAAFCTGEIEHLSIGTDGIWKKKAPTSALIKEIAKEKGLPENSLNGEKIFSMAQTGDTVVKAAIANQMDALAAGIANICYMLNPERIIIGGGISAQADYLYPLLDAALRKRLIPLIYDNMTLCFAALKNDAGMIGALYNFLRSEKVTLKQKQTLRCVTQNGIVFSHEDGLYAEAELKVHMQAPEGCTIAFTTNGTIPSKKADSGKSELDVTLNRTMSGYLVDHRELILYTEWGRSVLCQDDSLPAGVVLNTAVVDNQGIVSDKVKTNVYFLEADFARRFPNCLVVSFTTDPQNLLNYEMGIYALGAVYDTWRKSEAGKKLMAEKRYWWAQTNCTQQGKKWERPCQIQLFNSGSTRPDAILNAGIRIRGGSSRLKNQKSLTVYFRKKYGSALFPFKLFDKPDEYKAFALRNGDNEQLKFRDAFLQDLARGGHYTILDSRPAVVFLNGEYWGPYSLNEIISGKTMENRFGVDKNNVIVIKEMKVQIGEKEDFRLYKELQAFADKDLTDSTTYRLFCDTVDIRSMADFFALRIYIGDADWTQTENHVLWRTRDASYNGGRWQYIVHDTDVSSGYRGEKETSPMTDHFRLAIENFPVFAAALRNKEFYTLFLKAIKKIGSENFQFSRVQTKMNEYDRLWRPLMEDFYKRFGGSFRDRELFMKLTLDFFRRRYAFIIPMVESWKP
ncbi:MAG: ROK family protein [Acidaminococcaceae bacterium]|nr:ROK family protein [Acidaminococcaceae bacterium]